MTEDYIAAFPYSEAGIHNAREYAGLLSREYGGQYYVYANTDIGEIGYFVTDHMVSESTFIELAYLVNKEN